MQTLRIYAFNGSDVVRIVEQDIDTTLAKTASFLEMILKETDEKITHLEYAIN